MTNLLALRAFSDNDIWMLHDGREAVVVDPGADAPVRAALAAHDLRPLGILVTHHHADPVGGVDALRVALQGPLQGPAAESLPDGSRVGCVHEYTLSNLRFTAAVEPGNADRAAHEQHGKVLRAEDQPTLPSTIGLNRRINPFLRCDMPEVRALALAQGAANDDAVTVCTALRERKNRYR